MESNSKKFLEKNWFQLAVIILLIVFIFIYYGSQQKSPTPSRFNTIPVASSTTEQKVKQKTVAPASNMDSTCLTFYSKMKALDQAPSPTPLIYNAAELHAIQLAYQGEYDPALDSAHAKQDSAQRQDAANIQWIINERRTLSQNYGFCFEYLAQTYGYILSN